MHASDDAEFPEMPSVEETRLWVDEFAPRRYIGVTPLGGTYGPKFPLQNIFLLILWSFRKPSIA